jgi:hypothetical protein
MLKGLKVGEAFQAEGKACRKAEHEMGRHTWKALRVLTFEH